MEHNIGDGNPSANKEEKGGKRAPKIMAAVAAVLVIALISFASGYLGVKLASAPDTDIATQPAGTPQGDLPVYTAADNGQEQQSTQAPSPAPTITTETRKSKYPEGEVVAFEDPEVEKTIRATLGKPEGDITAGDMLRITSFKYDPINDKSVKKGAIKTLADLRYCENLESLNVLRQKDVTSIEFLREIDGLKDIHISFCSVSDLSPLAGKNSLEEVWISGNPVTDASSVLALPNLIDFNASWGTNITDISALPATSGLQNFFCDNKLKDFTPLLRLKNLRNVTLAGISDEFFREMVQKYRDMSTIRISNSDIKDESLKLLAGYSLYGLTLENCGLKDISGLADLASVSHLELGGNQIEDISVLKSFTQIGYALNLRDNNIRDFSPLEHLQPSILVVTGNPYTKASLTVLDKLAEAGCRVEY